MFPFLCPQGKAVCKLGISFASLVLNATVMNKQQTTLPANKRYVSDTAKLVHRHLSDPNHVISEEEIASIRVGVTPFDDSAQETAEASSRNNADE